MEFISGISKKEYVSIKELAGGTCDGKTVRAEGMVHSVRDMGDVRFVILRKAEGLVQCVYEEKTAGFELGELKDESAVRVEGVVCEEPRAPLEGDSPYGSDCFIGAVCGNAISCQQMEIEHFTGSKIELPSFITS